MGFTQVIEELSRMIFEQRQNLIRRALELDEPPLSPADETLVESRLADHGADPSSSVPLADMKKRG